MARLHLSADRWEAGTDWCGGTIISSKVIVSAAHCFWNSASDYRSLALNILCTFDWTIQIWRENCAGRFSWPCGRLWSPAIWWRTKQNIKGNRFTRGGIGFEFSSVCEERQVFFLRGIVSSGQYKGRSCDKDKYALFTICNRPAVKEAPSTKFHYK